jgi:HEAT repeat protein
MLKFRQAAPFLTKSLQSDEYVRANAARALAELRYSAAAPPLIHLLEVEQDAGVIEQTSLACE